MLGDRLNYSSFLRKKIFSTSAGGSWSICGLLIIMDVFTACLEIASKTIDNLTIDKVTQTTKSNRIYRCCQRKSPTCLGCQILPYSCRVLRSHFRKQLPGDFNAIRSTNPLFSGNSSALFSIHTHEKYFSRADQDSGGLICTWLIILSNTITIAFLC